MAMPSITTRRLSVGIQSDDTISGTLIYNYVSITPEMSISMSNSTLVFTYHGPDMTTALCGGLGYNLTQLAAYELHYENTPTLSRYAMRVCGVVQLCGGQMGDKSMFCEQKWSSSTGLVTTNTSLSLWNPASAYWSYSDSSTGVQLIQADGTYCSTIAKGRVTVTNFVCDLSATVPTLTSAGILRTCIYYANISTNLVCHAGDRGTIIPVEDERSTMTQCETFSGNIYEAIHCPRNASDPFNTPETMNSPTRILASSTGSTVQMTMPFNFFFYDVPITRFYIASNGLIEFGMSSTIASTVAPFPSLGMTTTSNYFPLILPMWNRMSNTDVSDGLFPYNGSISWSVEGEGTALSPRHMIIRWNNVNW